MPTLRHSQLHWKQKFRTLGSVRVKISIRFRNIFFANAVSRLSPSWYRMSPRRVATKIKLSLKNAVSRRPASACNSLPNEILMCDKPPALNDLRAAAMPQDTPPPVPDFPHVTGKLLACQSTRLNIQLVTSHATR